MITKTYDEIVSKSETSKIEYISDSTFFNGEGSVTIYDKKELFTSSVV